MPLVSSSRERKGRMTEMVESEVEQAALAWLRRRGWSVRNDGEIVEAMP